MSNKSFLFLPLDVVASSVVVLLNEFDWIFDSMEFCLACSNNLVANCTSVTKI